MKSEIADLWIEALKSGRFKQGRTALKSIDINRNVCHCCLGVLCELYQEQHNDLDIEQIDLYAISDHPEDHSLEIIDVYLFNKEYLLLPPKVMEWSGISSNDGVYIPKLGSHSDTLASNNDGGDTFEQIAKTIEKHKDEL